MDNYMNTLGISTAETGSGMMASMLMDAMDIGAIGMPQSKKEPKEKKGLPWQSFFLCSAGDE